MGDTLSRDATARAAFRKTGWAMAGQVTPATLATLRDVCDRLMAKPPEAGQDISLGSTRQFLAQAHARDPELAEVVLGAELREIAARYLGTAPLLFNEQFVVKGPRTGAPFAWHQDGGYVGFDHAPYLSVWIALDEISEANGPVYFLPRNLDTAPQVDPHVWDEDSKERVGYRGSEPGTPALVPEGGVVVFSSLTLHRSSANQTDAPRRAYLAQYSSEPILDPATGAPKRFATVL